MKTSIFVAVLVVGCGLPDLLQGQGTLYVSNLGQGPTGSAAVGSDAWIAQIIRTGANPDGYLLNSLQLLMNPAAGTPSNFAVSIYSGAGANPGSSLGSLMGPDPAAGGVFTYSTTGIPLVATRVYYVVLTSTTPVAAGAYEWSATSPLTSSNGWLIADGYYTSNDGLTWALPTRGRSLQLALFGTAVPEPGAGALVGLGMAAFIFHLKGRRGATGQRL
jgi:hypothetical protein